MTPFEWRAGRIRIALTADDGGPVSLRGILPVDSTLAAGTPPRPTDYPVLRQPLGDQPLVEVFTSTLGHARSGQRLVESMIGRGLRVDGIDERVEGSRSTLVVRQSHAVPELGVETRFDVDLGVAALTARTSVENRGTEPVVLTGISSLAYGIPTEQIAVDAAELASARSDWLAENRWTVERVRENLLPDLGLRLHGQDPRGAVTRSSSGSWSTGTTLPMGVLRDAVTNRTLAWQVESGGTGWTWEVGERRQGLVLVAQGPDDRRQQWRRVLRPGERFTSVPVTVTVSDDGLDGAVAELTEHRRRARRPHSDSADLPLVYNDYMNTLDGDPTTEKLLPLIEAAARVGAETFVIDAGWYDDGSDWWDAVGEWRPSTARFPGGLGQVIDAIREAGMAPGLWLEPEVVGERSPLVETLPPAAFFCRDGHPVLEHGRYHLDLRHPAALAHLDGAVDRLVDEFGVRFFKLDYNIDALGTEIDADSVGDGLLRADRARLAWIGRLLDRHPDLTLEDCGSGAMRADPGTLETYQLQSTSDQQNWLLCPPIAASAPLGIAPEQAANWAYPQADLTAEQNAFTLVTGLSARLYLSGFLDRMTPEQSELVAEAVAVYRRIRHRIATATPFWPTGLPGWTDARITLGYRDEGGILLFAWNRDGAEPFDVPLPDGSDRVTPLFPAGLPPWGVSWAPETRVLRLSPLPGQPTARLFAIQP